MVKTLKVGEKVKVPWGLEGGILAEVVEIWGDPPKHVRVRLLTGDEEDEPVVLLSPTIIEAA